MAFGKGPNPSQQRGRHLSPGDHPEESRAKRHKSSREGSPKRIRISDDVDFARDDWDGRIKRCEERIKDGYAKETFERQLMILKKARDRQAGVMKQFPGKSWGVIQRIGALQQIAAQLKKKDPCKELVNVEAVLEAYESGKLEWNDDATYWCQGKMIAGPSPFSFEDFARLNTDENRGDSGFWVEGIYPLEAQESACRYKSQPAAHEWDTRLQITLRLDSNIAQTDMDGNAYPELDLEFLDDTGASAMIIYNNDMLSLIGGDSKQTIAPRRHTMGYHTFKSAAGSDIHAKIIAVQANIVGVNNQGASAFMGDWTTVCCAVFDEDENTPGGPTDRLNGPYLRKTWYTATAPERNPRLYVGANKSDLTANNMLPALTAAQRTPPRFTRPESNVAWVIDVFTGLYQPAEAPFQRGKLPPNVGAGPSGAGPSGAGPSGAGPSGAGPSGAGP